MIRVHPRESVACDKDPRNGYDVSMMISAEVSDAVRGSAAARLNAELDIFINGHGWREVGHGVTNDEGRIFGFGEPAAPGIYRIMFDVASYMPEMCFPSIAVTIEIRNLDEPRNVRIVLSTFGYTVYCT